MGLISIKKTYGYSNKNYSYLEAYVAKSIQNAFFVFMPHTQADVDKYFKSKISMINFQIGTKAR